MQYITTISRKGQIVVPKDIRDKLKLKSSDTLKVTLVERNIVVEPLSSVRDLVGIFKARSSINRADIKYAYKNHLSKKYK